MKRLTVCFLVVLVLSAIAADAKGKTGAEVSFSYMDTERTYFIFEASGIGENPPILLLLHGSGRRGDSLIKPRGIS